MWTHVEFDPHGDPTVFSPTRRFDFSVTAPLWQGSRLTEQTGGSASVKVRDQISGSSTQTHQDLGLWVRHCAGL